MATEGEDHFLCWGDDWSAPMCWYKGKSGVLQKELELDGSFPGANLAAVCSFIL